jgi:ppGpp synthetase/RelA/SpoT-type nucleotidyltranferase
MYICRMAWAKPEYSREKVNAAGNVLMARPTRIQMEFQEALNIINNWRASHNFPLNTFQTRLRKLSKDIDTDSIVAQRIKRLASISHKLDRFQDMKVTQIQDIGGCRTILSTIDHVDQLVDIYLHKGSRGVKHDLSKKDDYILNPKDSGYRGVHLIYKYQSDKSKLYADLKIEIQIRTFLQHAWATAVETVSTFFKQALKSSQGDKEWLRFFALMGSVMAIKESRPLIPNTPTTYKELQLEIVDLSKKLDVIGHLDAFRQSLSIFDEENPDKDAQYYLLELDVASRRVLVKSYTQSEIVKASKDYIELEAKNIKIPTTDVVLVSADSIEKLKIAYPNYYLDTALFLRAVREVVSSPSQIRKKRADRNNGSQGELNFKS